MKLLLKQRSRLKSKEWRNLRSNKKMLRLVSKRKSNSKRKKLKLTKKLWQLEQRNIRLSWTNWPSSRKRDKNKNMKKLKKLIRLLLLQENFRRSSKLQTTRKDSKREEPNSLLNSVTSGSMDRLVST